MANNGGKNDVVELEAMLKDSFSWHPCQVSLCATGFGLLVTFGDGCLEETISDKEGVLSRVRVRSSPLQGDDCSSIKQGDHVLAVKNSDAEDVFCDAKVEKANRVRHSKRNQCRCSFTIKWLQESHEGEVLTIPASAIMRLARKDISLHPTISAFFDTLDSSNGEDALPFTTAVGGMDWEVDINVLLERQIEQISNSNNVIGKKTSQKCMFGLKVDLNKEYKDMDADVSFKDQRTVTYSGSTVAGPTKITKENHPAPLPSVQEGLASRSPLNPLAARAALALSRSKLSQGAELSERVDVEKGDVTRDSGISNGKNAKYEGIVKKLFPIPTPGFTEIADYSPPSKAQAKGKPNKHKNSEKKIIQPSETRLTRTLQRNSQTTETRETQLMISSKTTRITRSTVDIAEKIELKAAKATEEDISVRRAKSDAHKQNIAAHRSFSTTRRATRLTVDGAEKIDLKASNATEENVASKDSLAQNTTAHQSSFQTTRVTRATIGGVERIELKDNRKPEENLLTKHAKLDRKNSVASQGNTKTSTPLFKIENCMSEKDAQVRKNSSKRLTRSAAKEEAPSSETKTSLLKKDTKVDVVEKNASKRQTRSAAMLNLESSIHLPDASAQFTEERQKRRKISSSVETTPNSSESVSGNKQGTKKPVTRFSPRLNSPQTRSKINA